MAPHRDDSPHAQCRLRHKATAAPQEEPEQQQQKEKKTNVGVKVTPGGKSQFSSFILFASVIILVNLCSFQVEPPGRPALPASELALAPKIAQQQLPEGTRTTTPRKMLSPLYAAKHYLTYLDSLAGFVRLLFTQPMRLQGRTTRYTLAEARVLGKMAKVWYIKKKIKKLSKKLKKHTIAVPVFTAIPIYEHSYYPQHPHVTHVSHAGAMHHAAAASSYAPAAIAAAAPLATAAAATSAGTQQLATSASNQHHQVAAYRAAMGARAGAMYAPHMGGAASGSHHIINAYAPSPPLFVDDNGGLYGHYGNAYGRYDGGYHMW